MRRRSVWIVICVVLAVAGMIPFLGKGTSELPVYTTGAERMLAQEEIYRRDDAKAFTYPPFFAVPFLPFLFLPAGDTAQRTAWYLVNLAALIAILSALRSIVRPLLRREAWFWVALLGVTVRHVLAVFQNQSHDLLVCLVVALGAVAWGRGRGAVAGAWVGIGAACKATPLLFGLPFVLQRRLGPLVGITFAFTACSVFPDVLFPRVDGRLWIQAWYEIMVAGIGVGDTAAQAGVWHPGSFLNQSVSGTLYRLTTPMQPGLRLIDVAPVHLTDGGRKAVILAAQLGVVALIALASWRRIQPGERQPLHALGLAGAVACGMVLLSPMSSKSHFCVLVLPAAYCIAVWLLGRADRVLRWSLIAAFVIGTLSTKGLIGRTAGEFVLACGSVTWAAACLLAGTCHAVFRGLHDAVPVGAGGPGANQA